MRRIVFALLLSIIFSVSLISPHKAQADCNSDGGTCRMLGCDFDEQQTSAFCSGAGKCCVEGGPGCKTSKGGLGINSAIGCIPTDDINETAAFFLKWGIGIAGGIALITIIYASMLIISASGDPKRVMAGKELLMAAIMGLILLIFGVFVLRMVGVDVLGIPGL